MEKRLHVGNLEYSTTNEELEKLFSSEGTVTSAKVIRTLEEGLGRPVRPTGRSEQKFNVFRIDLGGGW